MFRPTIHSAASFAKPYVKNLFNMNAARPMTVLSKQSAEEYKKKVSDKDGYFVNYDKDGYFVNYDVILFLCKKSITYSFLLTLKNPWQYNGNGMKLCKKLIILATRIILHAWKKLEDQYLPM